MNSSEIPRPQDHLAPGEPPAAARFPAPHDVVALAQLWAGQFQHMTTLALAGAGGLLVLLQVAVVSAGRHWWIAFIAFVCAASVSIFGQASVVDDATAGRAPHRGARVLRMLGFMCFGAAGYGFTRALL